MRSSRGCTARPSAESVERSAASADRPAAALAAAAAEEAGGSLCVSRRVDGAAADVTGADAPSSPPNRSSNVTTERAGAAAVAPQSPAPAPAVSSTPLLSCSPPAPPPLPPPCPLIAVEGSVEADGSSCCRGGGARCAAAAEEGAEKGGGIVDTLAPWHDVDATDGWLVP